MPARRCGLALGRPRSESSRLSLLETAYTLMTEYPVHAISTQEIAHQAGVSTATLYRWWPTKEALLLDAVLHVKAQDPPIREDGRPLDRLRDHLLKVGKSFEGKQGRVAARLLAAIQDDEGLREAFVQRLYLPQSNVCLTAARQAVAEGDLPAGTDVKLLMDAVFGTILVRLLVRHQAIEGQDLARAFDLAVAGMRALATA